MDGDINRLLSCIEKGQRVDEENVTMIFRKITEVLYLEGNVQPLSTPLIICGDIHGQLYDLFKLFKISGGPQSNRYLFLGDYVDRGYYSLETFLYLVLLKLKFPDHIYLLRGNHECRQVNQLYGFYDECMTVYGHTGIYRMANEVFDLLPIAAHIDNSIFCVHGGLSPDIKHIDQISLIDRQDELPAAGPFADLTWSDPYDIETWEPNQRGAGWLFGIRPTHEFCQNNKLELICRAHQIAMSGYQYHFGETQLVTVWSAPNYMYRSGNDASVLKIDENHEKTFVTFKAVPDSQRIVPNDKAPIYFA